jgi:hypothetical protein
MVDIVSTVPSESAGERERGREREVAAGPREKLGSWRQKEVVGIPGRKPKT